MKNEGDRGCTPRLISKQNPLSKGIFANLKDWLTERRVKVPRGSSGGFFNNGTALDNDFWGNIGDFFRPLPKSARGVISRMEVEWESWHRVFWNNLRDAIAPPKLPPQKTAGHQVKSIWSRDGYAWPARAAAFSLQLLLVGGIVAAPLVFTEGISFKPKTPRYEVVNISISPYLAKLPAGKDKAGGGGGGGERMPTPPTKGRLPKWSMTQLTPPMATLRNLNPKLPAEPTLLGPPELKVPSPNLQNYGDPLAQLITGSGGPGGSGGIGTSCCGGIGSGDGHGLGPGSGGGTGGGEFRPGVGGVGYPECVYCPLPLYSDEARKAKYQGTVTLKIIVMPEGRADKIQVIKGPGLGLEEKAMEAVKTWRFKPALGPGGKPVPVQVLVEVTFRLL